MISKDIHFILVPDSGAARRIRRLMAEGGASLGVVAGTWPDLVRLAAEAKGIAVPDGGYWKEALYAAARSVEGAFWEKTLAAAPSDTLEIIERTYAMYLALDAAGVGVEAVLSHPDMPSRRLARNLGDIGRLHAALGGALPPEHEMMRRIADSRDPGARRIRVYRKELFPPLNEWQSMVVSRLNGESAEVPANAICEQVLESVASPQPLADPGTDLHFLQSALYAHGGEARALSGDAQWIRVRDPREEAEVAVGMISELLERNPDWRWRDIGLLLPPLPEYTEALADVLDSAGIPASGLPDAMAQRDLGREAVSLFIATRMRPAPAMADAALLCSPLMPWRRDQGRALARRRMEGAVEARDDDISHPESREMLALVNSVVMEPWQLKEALRKFVALLRDDDETGAHVERARETARAVAAAMDEGAQSVDWQLARALSRPERLAPSAVTGYNLEGVTCVMEGHEPWRPTRHLIVLGFFEKHYPVEVAQSQVFQPEDMRFLERFANIRTHSRPVMLGAFRQRFRRQISSASDGITFLMPMMNQRGERLGDSETMVFMSHMFRPPEGFGRIECAIDSSEDRQRVFALAMAPEEVPSAPRAIEADDLRLDANLLVRDGQPVTESPTSLETLAVSPLAWLMRKLGAEPVLWEPEALDGRIIGRMTHDAFRQLFSPDRPLPDESQLESLVESALLAAAKADMAFMAESSWMLERGYLMSEVCRAARAWLRLIRRCDARIVGSETRLYGNYRGLPISGIMDTMLELRDSSLMVFDYKKSRHEAHQNRMGLGFDLQAPLYRIMLDAAENRREVPALARYGDAPVSDRTGIGYFALNDQQVVSDTGCPGAPDPSWVTVGGEISAHALALVDNRLDQVSRGEIELNRHGDREVIEKSTGIRPYALDLSPLIDIFSVAPEVN